jgi:lipopolysaccharide/colanic/teichoic acid biosynthesis glycosyltransferase
MLLGSAQRDTPQDSKTDGSGVLPEDIFAAALSLERKRTERSGKPFLLALFHSSSPNGSGKSDLVQFVVPAIQPVVRETDVMGWYQRNAVLGVVFTHWQGETKLEAKTAIDTRLRSLLANSMPPETLQALRITYHFYPGDSEQSTSDNTALHPGNEAGHGIGGTQFMKRAMDIGGSLLFVPLLVLLFVIIGALIKINSKGPVLFRQTRVGRWGKTFTFFKFRSMYDNNDPSVHRDYVTRLIAGQDVAGTNGAKQKVFKIREDPRITSVGRILRRSSLDELPQFINVLKGDMSLVGPRPPLPYEFERYEMWHRQRVMEVRPGITGLWQVSGRSKTTFDEMVRLDLQYARTWSIWLDLKILFRTPVAVLSGEGAY